MAKSLDELFSEVEAERAEEAKKPENPADVAKREAQRKAEIEKEIRQGLRDAEGNWIEQPETDEEDEPDEEDTDNA